MLCIATLPLVLIVPVNGIIEGLTAQGMTVLLSTHDVDYAYGWADEVILFHEGRVLRQGPADEVLRDREALLAANLQLPAVPRFYDALCAAGVLDPSVPCPRTMEALETLISARRAEP